MDFLSTTYIIFIIVGMSAQSVIKKAYNNKSGGRGAFIFSAFTVLAACLFFVVKSGFSFEVGKEILPYAFGFAAAYCIATLFNFFAIQCGPLSLTSLAISYSLIIPTLYGLIFDGDSAGVWLYIGLVLLAVSLVLINAKKGDTKITVKWIVCALLALIGNGVCSTVQTVQSDLFEGKYDDAFMVISLACVFFIILGFALFKEKDCFAPSLKIGIIPMVICGVTNGAVNLLVMLASETVNKSVMFPLISAGGIVLTWIISIFLYKEKLTLKQNIGLILGVAAIIFLNL